MKGVLGVLGTGLVYLAEIGLNEFSFVQVAFYFLRRTRWRLLIFTMAARTFLLLLDVFLLLLTVLSKPIIY